MTEKRSEMSTVTLRSAASNWRNLSVPESNTWSWGYVRRVCGALMLSLLLPFLRHEQSSNNVYCVIWPEQRTSCMTSSVDQARSLVVTILSLSALEYTVRGCQSQV